MMQIYLVPGFFGFTQLGSFAYFHRVRETLARALARHGISAQIIDVDTIPTGSIRRRARTLLHFVSAHGGSDADAICFVGHSTGGLDIRMLLTPGVRLGQSRQEAEIADKTRAAVFLSTPHYGTPLASVFTGLNGRYLLYLLTILATTLPGRYALYLGSRWLTTLAHLDELIGQRENILDSLADNLLSQITPEKGDPTWQFVRRISQDQGAIVQLTPESMEVFNATVVDDSSVEYVSFISASPAPRFHPSLLRPTDIYRAFTYTVYALSYWLAGVLGLSATGPIMGWVIAVAGAALFIVILKMLGIVK